jgi:hypothetical protein
MFPAHLSLGCNYAEFPYFYLKPPAGQCADLATFMLLHTAVASSTAAVYNPTTLVAQEEHVTSEHKDATIKISIIFFF